MQLVVVCLMDFWFLQLFIGFEVIVKVGIEIVCDGDDVIVMLYDDCVIVQLLMCYFGVNVMMMWFGCLFEC